MAVLIGKRGKTIDSIQYLVGAAVASAGGEASASVTVDAAGYRDRREARLAELRDEVGRAGAPGGTADQPRADELGRSGRSCTCA